MTSIGNNNGINLLIIEDQQIIVDGLLLILSSVGDFRQISSCLHTDSLIETIKSKQPDVILLDFNMPILEGISCLKAIISTFPEQKVLMFTGYDDTELIREALKQGAKGYVFKDICKDELITAIKAVYKNQKYLDNHVQNKVLEAFLNNTQIENYSTGKNKSKIIAPITKLSNREKEVLELIIEGHSSSKIAEMLFISVNTVDTHRKNMMAKCGVHKITELVTFANKHHLF